MSYPPDIFFKRVIRWTKDTEKPVPSTLYIADRLHFRNLEHDALSRTRSIHIFPINFIG
jgi:hypothetical protein